MTPPGPGDPPVPPRPGSAGDEGTDSRPGTSEAAFADPTRRTYLAQERTLLAWWRTALGTIGVAVAIGSLLPKLTQLPKAPFIGLGAGYAALSLWFVLLGPERPRVPCEAPGSADTWVTDACGNPVFRLSRVGDYVAGASWGQGRAAC